MIDEPQITKEQLNNIKAKVLVLTGDRDLIERAHTEYIAKEIPKSKLKILKILHGVPIEKADELNQDVIQFIQKNSVIFL